VHAVDRHGEFLLWEDQTGHGIRNNAWSVVLSSGMAVVSELLQVSASEADTSIRAYDVDNGTVRWEDTVPNNGTRGFVAESEGSVFAAVAIPSSNISSGTFVRSSSPGKRRDVAAAICSSAALTL